MPDTLESIYEELNKNCAVTEYLKRIMIYVKAELSRIIFI